MNNTKIFPLKTVTPNGYNKYKNLTAMCIHCNHDFYGKDIVLTIDNEFFNNLNYDPKKHKVISPDEKNLYWLTCPSCNQINRNGFREILGGINKDGIYI